MRYPWRLELLDPTKKSKTCRVYIKECKTKEMNTPGNEVVGVELKSGYKL